MQYPDPEMAGTLAFSLKEAMSIIYDFHTLRIYK